MNYDLAKDLLATRALLKTCSDEHHLLTMVEKAARAFVMSTPGSNRHESLRNALIRSLKDIDW